jgi:hypothetical protein
LAMVGFPLVVPVQPVAAPVSRECALCWNVPREIFTLVLQCCHASHAYQVKPQ